MPPSSEAYRTGIVHDRRRTGAGPAGRRPPVGSETGAGFHDWCRLKCRLRAKQLGCRQGASAVPRSHQRARGCCDLHSAVPAPRSPAPEIRGRAGRVAVGQGSRSKEALRVLSRWTQQHDRLLAANRAQVSSPFTLWRFQQAMAIYVITAQDPLQLCSKSWAFLPTESSKREMRPLSHDRERLKPPPAVMVVEKGIEIGDRAGPADPRCGACLLLPTNRCKYGEEIWGRWRRRRPGAACWSPSHAPC